MEENRNIYRTPEPETPPEVPAPRVDPRVDRLRRQTGRKILLFVLVMLALLGGSLWLIYRQEKKRHVPEPADTALPAGRSALPFPLLSDLKPGTGVTEQAASTADARLASYRPPRLPPPAPVPPMPGESVSPPAALTPEQTAQAMRELRMAQEYLRARELDKAELHAKRVLEQWPQLGTAMRLLGVIYTQRGQFEQAIAILEQALALNPLSVEGVNTLATAYMQKGMYEKAEELLQNAEMMNPEYWPAQVNLGLLNLLRGRYEAAADYLEKTIHRVPNDPGPRNNLAVALLRLGRYDESRRHLQQLIDLNPRQPASYFNLAITYVLERHFDEAMIWIQRGAEHCSPVTCQKFLADSDFNAIRNHPPFQAFIKTLYPELPAPPQG